MLDTSSARPEEICIDPLNLTALQHFTEADI